MGATATIGPPAAGANRRRKKYRTNHIVDLVTEVIETNHHEVADFAVQFPPNWHGLRALFNWVDRHIQYQEDPSRNQWVQTPAVLNERKKGDCKSFTVLMCSTLKHMGLDSFARFAAYNTSNFRHVYPVAILDGKEVPMDVVWKIQEGGRFGTEKSFTKKQDFKVEGLYKIGNVDLYNMDEEAIIGQMKSALNDIERTAAQIPNMIDDGVGDVTQMSKGELERLIWADRYRVLAGVTKHGGQAGQYRDAALAMEQGDIAGIGSLQNDPFGRQVQMLLAKTAVMTEKAFPPFKVAIQNPMPAELRGLFKKIGGFIKKVGKAISGAFKKFVNWIFKGTGKKMGPYYLYQFYDKSKIRSPKILDRIKAQEKSYNFIRKMGKFDDKQLKGLMLNGIIEASGKSPKQIAQMAEVADIAGVGALVGVAIKAIGFVVKVIQKVAGIFKKRGSDAGRIDQSTMSDPSLLEEEAQLRRQANQSPTSTDKSGGGGFSPLWLTAVIPFLIK